MVSCYLSTSPQSHHHLRDAVRERWTHLVSERTPIWAVLIDDRPAIVAPTAGHLAVVSGDGPREVERTVRFDEVAEVSAEQFVVCVADDQGRRHAFTFLDAGDAAMAARLIADRRAGALGALAVVREGPVQEADAAGEEQPECATDDRSPQPAGRLDGIDSADLVEFASRDLVAVAELPIEREVAWLLARSGGAPLEPPPDPDPAEIEIPAQASAAECETVLMVTTEQVPGRVVAAVHGEVLGLAAPTAPVGRNAHDVARKRLAQAALRRGANAVVGMRYWASVVVPGEIAAYGTAVTLAPVELEQPAPAAMMGE